MMAVLHVISGGAAQGLVDQVRERFEASHGHLLDGSFSAVGQMKDKLLAGAPCDVVILTDALIRGLADQGQVLPGSVAALGVVRTGLAVKKGRALPPVRSAADLAAFFRNASGIYIPDPVKATAGIHFMKVLKALGLDQALAAKLRPFPNGATAMREMAQAEGDDLVGCSQVTEILYTPGVELVSALPKEFELATVYTAAVCTRAAHADAAAELIRLLTSEETKTLRDAGGFEPS